MEEDDVTKRLRITEKTVEDLASQLHLISQSRNYPTSSSPPQSQSQSQSELESTYQENTQLTRCCCEIQSLKSGEIIGFGKCQARDRIISLERDLGVCACEFLPLLFFVLCECVYVFTTMYTDGAVVVMVGMDG